MMDCCSTQVNCLHYITEDICCCLSDLHGNGPVCPGVMIRPSLYMVTVERVLMLLRQSPRMTPCRYEHCKSCGESYFYVLNMLNDCCYVMAHFCLTLNPTLFNICILVAGGELELIRCFLCVGSFHSCMRTRHFMGVMVIPSKIGKIRHRLVTSVGSLFSNKMCFKSQPL